VIGIGSGTLFSLYAPMRGRLGEFRGAFVRYKAAVLAARVNQSYREAYTRKGGAGGGRSCAGGGSRLESPTTRGVGGGSTGGH
jgi:hypothetical protein